MLLVLIFLVGDQGPDSVAYGRLKQPVVHRCRVEHSVVCVLRKGQINDVTLRICEIQEVLVRG